MRDGMPRHLPLTIAGGLVALAAIVALLVTHLLAALAILGAAGVLVVLLRHGDRLTVAWWPSRGHQDGALPASTTGRQAPTDTTAAQPERDPWLT